MYYGLPRKSGDFLAMTEKTLLRIVTLNSFQGLSNIVSLQSMCYIPVCEMLKQVQHDSLTLSWKKVNTFSPLGRGIEGVVELFISTLTRIRNVRKAHKRIRPLP